MLGEHKLQRRKRKRKIRKFPNQKVLKQQKEVTMKGRACSDSLTQATALQPKLNKKNGMEADFRRALSIT